MASVAPTSPPTATAAVPGVTPTVPAASAPTGLADTMASLGDGARSKLAGFASAVDPRNVDWTALQTHLPALPHTSPTAILVAALVGISALIVSVYYIVRMYRWNERYCPVFLSDPIRGTNITTMPSRTSLPIYPVVDRKATEYKGIRLPYRANDLALIDTPKPLPELNHSVEFTLSFWLRVENYQNNNPNNRALVDQYPQLFVQNPDTRQFRVMYDATNNALVFAVNIRTKLGTGVGSSGKQVERTEVFRVPDVVRVQEWQMVTVALNNRDLDVYFNGELHRSFHLANVPDLTDNAWRLYPGEVPFTGMVSCVRYFHYGFNTHEVARLHKWQRNQDIPRASYFWWWTWYRGNSFTALFDNFQQARS